MKAFRTLGIGSGGDSGRRASVEALEGRVLLSVAQDVVIGTGGVKAVTFTDADGTKAVITMKGDGSATVHFSGDTISESNVKKGTAIDGTNVTVTGITATGTTAKSLLSVSDKGGNKVVDVGAITSDGSLKGVSGKGVDLTNGIDAAGALGQVAVHAITGGTIVVGDPSGNLKLKAASDSTFDLNAGSVKAIAIKGNLTDSHFTLTSATAGKGTDLGSLKVSGVMNNVRIDSTGSLGTLAATQLMNSKVFAGVGALGGNVLPTSASDFSASDTIASMRLKAAKGALADINSDVAAQTLGKINLGTVQLNNGGTPFGVAGTVIDAFTAIDPSSGKAFKGAKLSSQAQVDAEVAKGGVALQDFEIKIVS